MKIHKKQKKSIIIGVLIIVFAIVAAFLFMYVSGRNISIDSDDTGKTNTPAEVNYAPPTEEQQNGGESAKKDLANQDKVESSVALPIELSAFKKSSGTIHVTANIQSIVTSDGSCELVVKKDGDIKTLQSGLAAVTDYSSCKGFDITSLDSGLWQVQVSVTSGGKTGSASTMVEV